MSEPLLLRTIQRETTRRRPVWVMRQVGRYLTEHDALCKGRTFKELPQSADLAADVTMLPFKRCQLDAAIVFDDIASPLPTQDVKLDFAPGPIVSAPMRSHRDVTELAAAGGAEFAPEVLETLRIVGGEEADDNFLVRLRKGSEPDPGTPEFFHAVHGVGYRFTAGCGRPLEA